MDSDAHPLVRLLLLFQDLALDVLLLHYAFGPLLQLLEGNGLSSVNQQALLEGAQDAQVHLTALLEPAQGIGRQSLDLRLGHLLGCALSLLQVRVEALDFVDVLHDQLLEDHLVDLEVAQLPLWAHVVLVPARAFCLLSIVLHHTSDRELPVRFGADVANWNLVEPGSGLLLVFSFFLPSVVVAVICEAYHG